MHLFPAGVPRSFLRFRLWVAQRLEGTPVLFFAAVLGIAVLFRAGVGLLRPAPPVEEAPVFTTTAPKIVAAPAAPAADAEPRTKAHPVDPPAVGSGRLRTERVEGLPRRKPRAR